MLIHFGCVHFHLTTHWWLISGFVYNPCDCPVCLLVILAMLDSFLQFNNSPTSHSLQLLCKLLLSLIAKTMLKKCKTQVVSNV